MIETLSTEAFADELRPAVERLYDRHLEVAKPWAVYELIDWGQGASFKNKPWTPEDYAEVYGSSEDYTLDEAVRSAIYVNLLTEDNAPYYTSLLLSRTPKDHPLQQWNGQWTMEEGQHSDAIRDWAHISRAIDPKLLDDGRRIQMAKGVVPQPETITDMLAYVPFQEKATQVAHHNTRKQLPEEDTMGHDVLRQVAADEGRHYSFYRDLAKEALAIDPSAMMKAISKQVISFAMPGTGIPGFNEHSRKIANAGIYNLGTFKKNVVDPTLAKFDIENVVNLDDEAEIARDKLRSKVKQLGKVAARYDSEEAA